MRARYFAANSTESGASIPGHEIEPADIGPGDLGIADLVLPETTEGHIVLREALVNQFAIRYARSEVEWLRFPGSATV